MGPVTLILDASGEGKIDLRDPPADVADYIADVVGPLLGALGEIYAPATLAVVLDIAAKTASYAAAAEAPCADAATTLIRIIGEQRGLLRAAATLTVPRPLTAEAMW